MAIVIKALVGTVFPVFLLAGLGWLARMKLGVDVQGPARLTIYILNPAMTMNAILTSRMDPGEAAKIAGFALLLTAVMVTLTWVAANALDFSRSERNASVLSAAFMNAGNYGLPMVMLTFGQAGFDRAAVFMIMESILLSTLAVFFAAQGRLTPKEAVLAVFKLPVLWAALVALAVRMSGVGLPSAFAVPISMLSNGGLVVAILILGMQVAGVRLRGARRKIGLAALLRLVVSPLTGLGLIWLLHPEPLTAKVLVLQSAMPAAVNTSLLAVEFGTEPDLVSGTTMATTLLSLVTVTTWISFLQTHAPI